MKKITLFITYFLFLSSVKTIAQNDCVDAIVICGDADLSGLTTQGIGTQEIFFNNACSSQENNSIWLKIRIKHGGTFGFNLMPQSSDLVVDFDFWIYGPNVTCGNIGTAVRCSTTNPLNAQLGYNITGMNETESDVSEGPGADGNAFIHWMDVNDDDVYYIAIDRPAGESDFSIAWTGTATFYDVPIPENVNELVDLHECSKSRPDTAEFDLMPNSAGAIGNQTDVSAFFYTTYNDAVNSINAITNPGNFENSINPQRIFIRLTNVLTGCFAITDFLLYADDQNRDAVTDFSYETPICIQGSSPILNKDPLFSAGGVFSASPQGLAIDSHTGAINLNESLQGNYTVTYSIGGANGSCYFPETNNVSLEIDDCIIPKGISPIGDGQNDFFNIEKFDVSLLSIFNRYGVKVYHKENYRKEWHGQSDKGKELPDGTYYYLIELNDGKRKTGWVYLLRER